MKWIFTLFYITLLFTGGITMIAQVAIQKGFSWHMLLSFLWGIIMIFLAVCFTIAANRWGPLGGS
jgi:hypothetical protein